MSAAVESVFDVAFWFTDQALNDNEYLQPLKLQSLLYLAQAYFVVANKGRRLFPAILVADDTGPVEPSVQHAWTRGRPVFEQNKIISQDTNVFLESIWRRFGHHSSDHLSKLCRSTMAYQVAYQNGLKSEISVERMIEDVDTGDDLPDFNQVVRPKLVRSRNTGRTVEVKAWTPPVLDKKNL